MKAILYLIILVLLAFFVHPIFFLVAIGYAVWIVVKKGIKLFIYAAVILAVLFGLYLSSGLILQTSIPYSVHIIGSMEHEGTFDEWWAEQEEFYENVSISKEEFMEFPYNDGLYPGDVLISRGATIDDIAVGDIIIIQGVENPIAHRVVMIEEGVIQVKGDLNVESSDMETNLSEDDVLGKVWVRIPRIGYTKIIVAKILFFL